MTRINIVPVEELSDQHLIAEYRELPRVIKIKIKNNNMDAPKKYCLGKGHVKWAKYYAPFILSRYNNIIKEMKYRNFKTLYTYESLKEQWLNNLDKEERYRKQYNISNDDIEISRNRIKERYLLKPQWYRWTNRNKPEWL